MYQCLSFFQVPRGWSGTVFGQGFLGRPCGLPIPSRTARYCHDTGDNWWDSLSPPRPWLDAQKKAPLRLARLFVAYLYDAGYIPPRFGLIIIPIMLRRLMLLPYIIVSPYWKATTRQVRLSTKKSYAIQMPYF